MRHTNIPYVPSRVSTARISELLVGGNPGDMVITESKTGRHYLANLFTLRERNFIPFGVKTHEHDFEYVMGYAPDVLAHSIFVPYSTKSGYVSDRIYVIEREPDYNLAPTGDYEEFVFETDILPFAFELTDEEYEDFKAMRSCIAHEKVRETLLTSGMNIAQESYEGRFCDMKVVGPGVFHILDTQGRTWSFSLQDFIAANSDRNAWAESYATDMEVTRISAYPIRDRYHSSRENVFTGIGFVEWNVPAMQGLDAETRAIPCSGAHVLDYRRDILPFAEECDDIEKIEIDWNEGECLTKKQNDELAERLGTYEDWLARQNAQKEQDA